MIKVCKRRDIPWRYGEYWKARYCHWFKKFDQIIKEYKPTFIAGLPVNVNVLKVHKAKKFKILKLKHFVFSPIISHFNLIKFKNILKSTN